MAERGDRARGPPRSRWSRPTTWRCSTSTGSSTSGPSRPRRAGAPADVRKAAARLAFITNNASRPPDAVAAHLRDLGVEAEPDDVVTSAQAAAHAAARAARRGRRGRCWAGRARGGAASRRAWCRSPSTTTGRGAGDRLRPRRAVARRHARRGAGPRRAALGGQQHRPDHPDAVRHGPRARRAGRMLERFTGVEPVVAGKPSGRCSTRPSGGWAATGR